MAAKAQFESRVAESSSYANDSLSWFWWAPYYNNSNLLDVLWRFLWDILQFIAIIISVGLCIFGFFFFVYIIISLFKKWWENTLSEMSKTWTFIKSIFFWFFSGIKNIFSWLFWFFKKRKMLSVLVILGILVFNFVANIIDWNSRLLRLVKVEPWYVGVDLRKSEIYNPWYSLYSPLNSSFFLSPTNNFSFDIIDVESNSKEELPVTLDYRVTFDLIDSERLNLYKQNWAKNIRQISSDIVMPRMLEVINGIIKDYSFKDIGWKHSEIKEVTITSANKVLKSIWIEIKDLNIISINLPPSYLKSKEDLLKAENELRLSQAQLESGQKLSEKELLNAQNKKKIKIIEAEAISEYNKIIATQDLTPAMIEMKKLEIEEKKVEKWDGKLVGGEKFGM